MENTKGKSPIKKQELLGSAERLADNVSVIRYQVFQGIKLQFGDFPEPRFLPRNMEESPNLRNSDADQQIGQLEMALIRRFGKPVMDSQQNYIWYKQEFYSLYYKDENQNTITIIGSGSIAPENDLMVKKTGRIFNNTLFAVHLTNIKSGQKFLDDFRNQPFDSIRSLVKSKKFEADWFRDLGGEGVKSIPIPNVYGGISKLYFGESRNPLFPSVYANKVQEIRVIENGRNYEPNEYIRTVIS